MKQRMLEVELFSNLVIISRWDKTDGITKFYYPKHKSQVRIMRLLAKLGCKVYCESGGNFGRVYVEL